MKFKDFKPALTVALGMALFIFAVRQLSNFELTKGIASRIAI
jgi:hypothetical protein